MTRINNTRIIISFIVCLLIISFSFNCQKINKKRIQLDGKKLNHIMDSYVNDGIYPFLYARIEDDHGVIYEHSVSNKKFLGDIEINGDTWMRIWSMSKLVTISIAMDLVEDGLLKVNDPVTQYIPEFKNLKIAVDKDGNSISQSKVSIDDCPHELVDKDYIMTIKHLMNHTAGFYYTYTKSNCLNSFFTSLNIPIVKDGEELIKKLTNISLVQQPGEAYHYGLNTTVLGLVIERITGKSLSDTFEKRIAEKLNLSGLQYTTPDGVDLLPVFTGRNGFLEVAGEGDLPLFGLYVPTYSPNQGLFLGGEGMLGTAKGYIEYLRLLLDPENSFLKRSTIDMMVSKPSDAVSESGYQTDYAFYITGQNDEYKNNVITVGGYEFTKGWVDRENDIIGVLFSQVNSATDGDGLGSRMEKEFKKELYNQLKNQ
tara:strand:+ start:513 stop:1790 length:1278 start_codon:yes stop_codon:yes gene_type:complete